MQAKRSPLFSATLRTGLSRTRAPSPVREEKEAEASPPNFTAPGQHGVIPLHHHLPEPLIFREPDLLLAPSLTPPKPLPSREVP